MPRAMQLEDLTMPTSYGEDESIMPEDEWYQACRAYNQSTRGGGEFEPWAHAQICLFGTIALHAWRKS